MSRIRLGAAAATIGVAALVATAVMPATANAAGKNYLKINYTVTGTSTVKKTNSSLSLGPATLRSKLYPNATFSGSLPLPPTTSSFKALGLLPITATVSFIQVGKVTGSLRDKHDKTIVTSKAKDYIKLSNVTASVLGVPVNLGVGNNCQTADPVAINVATPAGKSFNVNKGGKITGTFTIGNFQNCGENPITGGLNTGLINQLVPGPGNTITLKLADPRIVK